MFDHHVPVLHNSIVISGTYPNAVEYGWRTTGVLIANNLLDAAMRHETARRHGIGQLTTAAGLFVNPAAGDLHESDSVVAIDRALQPDCMTDWDGSTRPRRAADGLGSFGPAHRADESADRTVTRGTAH